MAALPVDAANPIGTRPYNCAKYGEYGICRRTSRCKLSRNANTIAPAQTLPIARRFKDTRRTANKTSSVAARCGDPQRASDFVSTRRRRDQSGENCRPRIVRANSSASWPARPPSLAGPMAYRPNSSARRLDRLINAWNAQQNRGANCGDAGLQNRRSSPTQSMPTPTRTQENEP